MQLVQFLCAHQPARPLLQQLGHLEEQIPVGPLHLRKTKIVSFFLTIVYTVYNYRSREKDYVFQDFNTATTNLILYSFGDITLRC